MYSSSSLALATLELFVNLQIKRQLAHYVKSRIEIPEVLIDPLEDVPLTSFLSVLDQFDSRSYGDTWLAEERSCVLQVPSRVVPQEWNYLINPLHGDFEAITTLTSPYEVDERLLL